MRGRMSKLYFIGIYVVSRQAKKLSKEFFRKEHVKAERI